MEQRTSLTEIIEYINPGDLNYQEWINVGMALKQEGDSMDCWQKNGKVSQALLLL